MLPAIEIIDRIASIVASVVSTVGFIVGAIFAWWRWGRDAPATRRGDVTHEVVHTLLSASHRLVHVTLSLKNLGTATLRPIEAYTTIFQVLPLESSFGARLVDGTAPLDETGTAFKWPVVGHCDYPVITDELRIDSGESEKYDADFIMPASVSAVFVYSMACLDPEDPKLGWDVTTLHQFTEAQEQVIPEHTFAHQSKN